MENIKHSHLNNYNIKHYLIKYNYFNQYTINIDYLIN